MSNDNLTTIAITKDTANKLKIKKLMLQAKRRRELTYDDVIVILTQGGTC